MKKILLFAGFSKSIIDFRLNLLLSLQQEGYQIIVVCPEDRYFQETAAFFATKGISVHPASLNNTDTNIFRNLKTLGSLVHYIRKIKPNIILLYHAKQVLYVSWIAYFFPKIRCFSTVTGLGFLYLSDSLLVKLSRKIIRIFYKIACYRNERVFFQNQDDRAYFVEQKILNQNKTVVVGGSGVDLTQYPFTQLPKEKSFLFVGRLLKDKGIGEYIEAASRIKRDFKDVSFRILGGVSENPSALQLVDLQKQCSESGLEYLGEVEDVLPFLQQAMVFVLPSYREGTSRAGLEALAVGRPVITTDAPGCRDLITGNENNGFLVNVRDVDGLEKAMRRMLALDESAIQRMGDVSRQHVENKYDVIKVNANIMRYILPEER